MRRFGAVVVLGGDPQTIRQLLPSPDRPASAELVPGAAAIVLIDPALPLPRTQTRRLRASLGPRGRVIGSCDAAHLLALWRSLRAGGLEPKHTLLEGSDVARHAVVSARVAKPGGLSMRFVPSPGLRERRK